MTKPPVQNGLIQRTTIQATKAIRNPRPTVPPPTLPPKLIISSKENSTPPIGAPNATATPAAEEAAYISLMEKADLESRKSRDIVCPAQTATWTLGPSFPTLSPEAIANGKVIVLIARLKVN